MNTNQPQAVNPENDADIVVVDQYDAEGLKKNLETTLAQKKHWREKAVDKNSGKSWKELYEAKVAAEAAAAARSQETPTPIIQKENPAPSNGTAGLDIFDSLDAIRDLKSDELSALRTDAKDLGIDPLKFIKSNAGKARLSEIRAANRANQGTPSPSQKVHTFNGRPVKDVLTDSNASSSDKQAAFAARIQGRTANPHQ